MELVENGDQIEYQRDEMISCIEESLKEVSEAIQDAPLDSELQQVGRHHFCYMISTMMIVHPSCWNICGLCVGTISADSEVTR